MTKPSEITELIADVREQVLYMQELGVERLGQKASVEFTVPQAAVVNSANEPAVPTRFVPDAVPAAAAAPASKRPSRLTSLPSLSSRPAAERRSVTVKTETSLEAGPATIVPEASLAEALFD